MTLEREPPPDGNQLLRNAPAVARLAAGLWWQATRWSVARSAQTGARLARAAADPVLAAQVTDELGRDLRGYARDLLGITELDHRLGQLTPPPDSDNNGELPERERLRIRGALLLKAAARIESGDLAHPAYARILTELAPDEGRILRLLATDGAQPAVDVRAANLIGVGSQLVAGGMNMIGAEAGCQHRDRVPAYLNNLERLGLIWFSREPIDGPRRLPGARGSARGPGGHAQRLTRQDRPAQHPHDPVRKGLLRGLPPARHRGDRGPQPAGAIALIRSASMSSKRPSPVSMASPRRSRSLAMR